MKKSFTTIFILVFSYLCLSQNKADSVKLQINELGNIYFEKIFEFENNSKDDIYLKASDWFGEYFNNPDDVLSYTNRETGKLKGNFISDYDTPGLISLAFPIIHTISIAIKDNRMKVVISDIKYFADQSYTLEFYLLKKNGKFRKAYKVLKQDVENKVPLVFNSLNSYIISKDNDDW